MRRKVKLHQFAIIVNMGSVVGCSTASLEILEFPPDTTLEASRDDSWRSFRATAPTSPIFGSCRTSMVLFSQICLRKPGSTRTQLAAAVFGASHPEDEDDPSQWGRETNIIDS